MMVAREPNSHCRSRYDKKSGKKVLYPNEDSEHARIKINFSKNYSIIANLNVLKAWFDLVNLLQVFDYVLQFLVETGLALLLKVGDDDLDLTDVLNRTLKLLVKLIKRDAVSWNQTKKNHNDLSPHLVKALEFKGVFNILA